MHGGKEQARPRPTTIRAHGTREGPHVSKVSWQFLTWQRCGTSSLCLLGQTSNPASPTRWAERRPQGPFCKLLLPKNIIPCPLALNK